MVVINKFTNFANIYTHTNQLSIIMKRVILVILLFSFLGLETYAQSFYGKAAKNYIQSAKEVHINKKTNQIDYIAFDDNYRLNISGLNAWLQKQFKLSDNAGLVEISRNTDKLDQTHIRYKLSVNNVLIHDAMIIVHANGNSIFAINGNVQSEAIANYSASITEATALNYALSFVDAEVYKWQLAEEEQFIKDYNNDSEASFFPTADMRIIRNKNSQNYRLSYRFNIYAHKPMSRQYVFVDAQNGEILFTNSLIHHSDSVGSALTKYSSTKTITTDLYNSSFRLRESGRGLGIETYDLNTSTSYGAAVDFTDSDNYWNNVNSQQDEIATDAHWGMEMTYDYFYILHNRNSIDGNGYKLRSYVHYDNNYANAFWNGQFMTFGDGNSSIGPLVSLDIVGHEISHGLTSNTADLDYQDESGAMNEAFSDIFGTAIEFYGKPSAANWLMGENIGNAMRSMSNPKSKGDPDTYLGQYYYLGTADNGGVHTNSGVLNHCFYLMSAGGTGINDNNDTFNVSGVGIDTAGAIAFRALTVYLVNTSQHIDGRFYFIKSAIDLYGPCSAPVEATTNAFYAVGIGAAYQSGVNADFDAVITNFCQPPAAVSFSNLSNNGMSFIWDFGDGSSSTALNPTHTYTSYGDFTVSLSTNGGSCGQDSIIKIEYISVDTANPCLVNMPPFGSQTITDCKGILFDSGGPNNYADNTNVTTTISPIGAMSVTLTFTAFDFETGYDYLKIYNGTSASSPLIGTYDGNNLPNGGTIVANSGSVTLVQTTDAGVTKPGFIANWQCNFASAPPVGDFIADDTNTCSGIVTFTDLSQNGPNSWAWDFGDGSTSSQRNPTHTYGQSGTYTVSLTATNNYGNHQIIKNSYIKINKPWQPIIPSGAVCNSGIITLNAVGNGLINWYTDATSSTILDTGAVFTTPNLSATTSYWAENIIEKPIQSVGKAAATPGGANLNYDQSLIFDVYKNVILKTVKVYAYSAGSRTIKLTNSSGTTLDSKVISVVIGWNTVTLDFNLPIATELHLAGKNLHRSNVAVSYPYSLPGVLSINKSSAGSNPLNYYYYFYDWEVQEIACKSPRVEVFAYVNQNSPSADFSTNGDPYVQFDDITTNPGTNHWNFGDQSASQLGSPIHLYLQNGTFQVKLVVDNGCGLDSITKPITVSSATGINNIGNSSGISLYPNPNNGIFNLQIEGEHQFEDLEVYDMMGNLVLQKGISKNDSNTKINISTYSSGVYYIRLISQDKIANLRLIKQ